MEEEEIIESLKKVIKRRKLHHDYFDDFVHQTASNKASEINNSGLSAQLSYLFKNGWSEDDIKGLFN